jgi:flagellum-specific peptidoglycan hydrolase FlgJ
MRCKECCFDCDDRCLMEVPDGEELQVRRVPNGSWLVFWCGVALFFGLMWKSASCLNVAMSNTDEFSRLPIEPPVVEETVVLDVKVLNYIDRFSKTAKAEQDKYGIPVSIKLAQGILESNSGLSTLSSRYNNHFGIKCTSKKCPKGHCVNFSDDHHKDFFRSYPTAWEGWRDHSVKVSSAERYSHLFENNDYKAWARGLQKAGYATDKKYADKLIRIIETYKLYEYD